VTDSVNVELVRSIYAALEHGDFGMAEWAHPQIEYVVADGPEPGSWVGKADMAQAARERLRTLLPTVRDTRSTRSSRMAMTSLSGAWPSSGPALDPVLRYACVGSPSLGSMTARQLEAQATQTGTKPSKPWGSSRRRCPRT